MEDLKGQSPRFMQAPHPAKGLSCPISKKHYSRLLHRTGPRVWQNSPPSELDMVTHGVLLVVNWVIQYYRSAFCIV